MCTFFQNLDRHHTDREVLPRVQALDAP